MEIPMLLPSTLVLYSYHKSNIYKVPLTQPALSPSLLNEHIELRKSYLNETYIKHTSLYAASTRVFKIHGRALW